MKISCPSETYPRIWQKKEWNNDMALDERKRAALDKFFKTKGPEDADFWRPSSDAADAAAYNAEIDRAVADAEQSSRFGNERNRQRRVDFLKGARIETPEPYVSGLSDEKRAALDRFFGFSAAARRASARPAGPQAPVTEMPETVVPTSSLLPSELPGDDGRQEPVVPDGELAARRAQSRKAALESSLDDVASGRIFGRGADESRPVPDTESLDWRENIASAWRGILGGEVVEDLARVSGTLSPGAAELRRRDAARDAAFREYMEQELRRSGFEGMSADERIAAMENLIPAAGETLKAGGETFTPEEFGEHLDRYAKDIEHLERFAEDASYRNDWLLQHTGLTEERYRNKVADELEGRLNEIERKLPRPGGGNSLRGGYAAIGRAMNEKPSSETPAVREWMTKARDVVNTLRKDSFGSGLREGFDFGNVLTAGFKGLGDNVNLIRVLNAASRGEKLTSSQQALVDAWSTQQEAEDAINMLGGRSLGAGIGAGFSESLEFMTGMLATSGVAGAATAGLRKAATSAAARSAARAVAHEATKKGWKSAISKGLGKGAVRLSESVVGAAARTPLTGQLYKGYTDKRLGQFSAEERPGDDGIEKTIRKAPRGAWKDALEAYLETTMEYQSEDVGQWIGAGANALSRRVAQSRLGTLMGLKNFSGAKRNAALQWFKENAKITNFAGEVLGEAYGDAMVNLFEENRQGWREMMTKDYWWTLGGVSALLSGPVGALGVPAQIRQARVASGLSRLERKALASIENPDLKDRMAKIAAMENITQRSRELAKLDWKSKEITEADAVHVLDFINARTKLDALQGSETEDRRLTRFIPVLETLDQLQYRGADGKNSTGEMMYAADNSGNSYIVLSGDPVSGDMLTVYDPVKKYRLEVPASEIAGWEKKGVSDVIAEEYALMFRVEANQEKLDNLFSRVREAAEAGVSDTALADMLLSEGIHVFKPGDEATLLDGQKVLVEDFSEGDYEVVLENGEKVSVGLNEVLQPDAEAARAQQASAQTQDAGTESSASETVPDEVRLAGVQAEAMAREAVVSVRNADDDIVYTVDVEGSDEPVNILRGASLVYDPQTGAVDVPATLRRAQEQGLPETVAIRYADGKPGMVHISELQTVLEAADSEEVVREARTAAEQQAAAMQQDAAEAEPAGSVPEETEPTAAAADPLVGRSLTDEEAGQVIGQMEAAAEPAPELELTPENWMAQFGEEGKVQTPIGEVKMGENQLAKLFLKGRIAQFGMVKLTLETPDCVIEIPTQSKDGNTERPSSLLFVKAFIGKDGQKHYFFTSVTVQKDDMEVSVSNHLETRKRIADFLKKGKLLYRVYGGAQTEQRPADVSVTASPLNMQGFQGEDTTTIPENQTAEAEIPRQKNGQPDFNAMPADMLAVELSAAVGHDKAVERLQVARGVNAKSMDKLRKSLDGMGDLNKAMAVEQRLAAMQQEDARLAGALEQLGAAEEPAVAETPAGTFTQEIDRLFPDGLPNVRARVLADIARGQRFVWNDSPDGVKRGVATELGFTGNESERRGRFGMLGSEATGAKHVSRYVHDLWQDSNGYAFDMDDAELRDEVIDVLLATPSRASAMEQLRDMAARVTEDAAAPRDAEDLAAMEAYDVQRNETMKQGPEAPQPGADDVPFSVIGEASVAPAGVTPERWKVIVDQLRRVIGAENVVTDPAAVRAAYDRIMGRGMEIRRRQVAEANERYNTQLDLFTEGKLPSGDKIDLGYPGATLLACGIRNAYMTIAQRVLKDHMEKHGLTADDIRNLPVALENPIMVYEWGNKVKTTIVITEIPRETERIAVALRFRQTVDGIKINKVVSVHGKSIDRLPTDMNTPLTDFGAENLKWVDKEKASDWLITGGSFGPSASDQRLVTAVKIVTNFENPKIGPENIVPQSGETRYFRTPEGEVYGFTAGGKIYLDSERMNAATPMHEYTELWSQIVARENPELWMRGVELMKHTLVWDEVNADPNYKELSEELRVSETLSRIVADEFAGKQDAITDSSVLLGKLRAWMRKFWGFLKGTFAKWTKRELDDLTPKKFAQMPLRDFVEGIDLQKVRGPKPEPQRAAGHKQMQLEIIERYNPMRDDVHTGIRNIEDIKSFEEVVNEAKSEGDTAYPDIGLDMLEEAAKTGRITVYSSYPIKQGVFVSPSQMNAADYAGGGPVYRKEVSVDDVAWITSDEGQYAKVGSNSEARFSFIGERGAENLDKAEEASVRLDNLAAARSMETAGKDALAIKMATGWERGTDGKWRYEIPDIKVIRQPEMTVNRTEEGDVWYKTKLGKLIDAPKLFTAYPQLADIEVGIQTLPKGESGSYHNNVLILNIDTYKDKKEDVKKRIGEIERSAEYKEYSNVFDAEDATEAEMNMAMKKFFTSDIGKEYYDLMWGKGSTEKAFGKSARSVLSHEIQHAIQDIEGFARGGNLTIGERIAKQRDSLTDWQRNFIEDVATYESLKDTMREDYPLSRFMRNMAADEARYGESISRDIMTMDDKELRREYNRLSQASRRVSPGEAYFNIAGEVEARNVQKRLGMSAEERLASLAEETEDVARKDQIILREALGGGAASLANAREFTERRVTTLEKLENKRDALIADRGNIANFDEQIAAVEAEIEAYMQSDPVAETFGKDGVDSAGDAHLWAVEDAVYDMQREMNLPTQTVVVRNADEFIARLREMGATDEQLRGISPEHCPEGAQWRGEIVIRGDAVADKVHARVIYIHEQVHDITEALFTPDELYDAAEEMGADYMNKRLEERNASYHVDGNSVESMIQGANEMISRGVDLLYRKGLLAEFFATENGPIYPVIMYMEEHGVPSRLKDLIVENLQNIKADQYGTERTRQNIPGEVERQLDSRLFPAREGDGTADETSGRTGTAGDAVPERIGAGAAGVAADAGGRIGGRGGDLDRPSFSFGDSGNDAPKLTKQQQLIADVEAAVSDPRNDIATTIRNFMPQVETLREALVEELEGDPAGELLSAFGSAGDRATAIGALREMRQALLDRDIRRKEEDARRRAERREYHEKVLNLYSRLTETDVEPDKLPQSVTSYIKTLVTPELMEVMGIRDFHSIATDIETALQQDKIQNTFAEYRKQRAHYRDIQQTETDPAVLEFERQVMESAARTFADRVLASRPMQRIMDAVADMDLRLAKNRFDDLLRLKVEGLNASGVNTAKSVDENTRVFFKLLRDNLGLTEAQLQAKIDKLQDGNAVNPLVNFDGVMLHAMYRACLEEENNIDDLKSRLRKYSRESVRLYHVITGKSKGVSDALREEARANRATARRAIDATRAALVAAKSHLAGNYANLNQHLTSKLETGKTLFSDVEEARKRHQKHLVSEAVKAVKPDPGSKTQNADFPEGSRFVKGITSPFASFESTLQTVSINDPGRNGFLTQHFMLGPDGWAEANGQYQQRRSEILNGILAAFDRLVLHKKSDTSDRSLGKRLVERLERPFKETDTDDLFRYFGERLSDRDGNPVILETTSPESSYYKSRSIVVTRGKALLWIAWGRQSELMPRLENIGLDREKLEILRSLLSKEDLAFLDWIQLELLPELLKERYNPVYRRMFGVDMDSTAWYFPFVANKNMVRQEVDMSQIESDGLPATITGSIIRRRHTMIEPDLDVDLMGVLTNHIGEMEHWAAFAPFISDINALLSSPTFRNALESQQKGRYSAFKKVCFIAADAYRKFQPDPSEQFLTTLEKTCASAKIAWRGFTALKQVLSGVMFRTYTSDARFQKIVTRHLWDPFVTWKDWTWCMENLPSFRERWESRYAGDERLALKSPSRGRLNQAIFDHRGIQKTRRWFLRSFMYMNALVDAWVCARGARAVYLFEMERLQERGLDAGEADRQAKILAAIAMNTTQQSSEGAYMSVLQSDRTYMSATLSIFNNSSFAFGRIAQQAFKVLTMSKARREEVLEARKRYWIGRGLDETQATTRAREDMRRLMRDARLKLLLAGYLGNLIWNLFPPVMTAFVGGFNRDRDNRDSSYWRTWWNTLRNEVSWSTFVTPVFRNFAGGSQAGGVVNGFDLSLSMALQDYEKLKKEVSDVISDFSPALALHLLGKVGALGLGVDFDTFVNMYKGAHKMFTRHETAAGIFQFLNSPKAILAAAEHNPGRGETDQEYMERMAYAEGIAEEEMKRMETAPSYRLDDSERKVLRKMKKWERNYLAYRQASALGMSWERDKFGNVTIPELKRLDEDYESAVKWMGLTRSGEPVDELKKNWDSLGRQEEELTIDIIGRVHAIYPFERELENNVVFGDEYREQMKALVKLKQEVVALVENNK